MVKVPLLSCTLGVLLLLSVGWLPYRAELSSLYEDGELTTVSRETGGLAPASDACFLRGTADPTYPIIDPVLLHSTSLGGSSKDEAWSIAVDREGNTYISGITHSPDFPGTTLGGNAAEKNVFVAKYTPTGELAYATVIGGESGEEGNAIAVDDYGNAYVAGETYSTSFPLLNPWRSAFGYEEAFLLKFDAAGQLSYSTFIGGTLGEEVNDIVADAVGNVYLGGEVYSDDYPLLNPWSATTYGDDDEDAFITIFDAAGEMAYSTLISASSRDQVFRIAVDDEGYVYGTGMTSSPDFPTVNAFQTTYGGEWDDCFVFKLDPWRNEMLYSTLLGGNGRDECWGIAVDDEGSAYVTGFTSSNNFPLAKPIQSSLAGSDDVFITKLSPTGDQLLFSTYIGGEGRDRAWDLALDGGGNVYVVGETDSPDFPTVDAIQGHHRGEMDGFLLVLDQANTIRYASYIGGFDYDRAYSIALDENWIVHVAGATDSTDFPRTDGAAAFAGNTDAFVAQYGLVPTPTPTPTPIPQAAATVGPEGGALWLEYPGHVTVLTVPEGYLTDRAVFTLTYERRSGQQGELTGLDHFFAFNTDLVPPPETSLLPGPLEAILAWASGPVREDTIALYGLRAGTWTTDDITIHNQQPQYLRASIGRTGSYGLLGQSNLVYLPSLLRQ